jgi:amino acid transporter
MVAPTRPESTSSVNLQKGAIGVIAAAALGSILMSPALGIYSWFPAIMTTSGDVVPLIFLIALLVSIPTAVSYALVSRHRPSAGSAYTWISETLTHRTGSWVGVIMALYYFGVLATMPVQFALYFAEFLKYLGFGGSQYLAFIVGVVLSTAIVAALSYPNVKVSARGAVSFMAFESLVVIALAATVAVRHAGQLNAKPLLFSSSTGGVTTLFGALIFGMLAFTGYDAVSTVAEETRTPRRLIPIAVVSALILTAVFWIVTSYFLSYSASVAAVTKYVSEGVTPFGPIANLYWGRGSILVDITGMTASLGVYIACTVGVARVIFRMGRDKVLPARLGTLHSRYLTPWNAMHLLFALAVVADLVGAAILGIYNSLLWIGATTVWFALITYLFVNVANFVFHRRIVPQEFHWFNNGVIPAIGVVVVLYLLYKGFFVAEWSAGFKMGQSVVLVSIALTVLAAALVTIRFRGGPVASQAVEDAQSFEPA